MHFPYLSDLLPAHEVARSGRRGPGARSPARRSELRARQERLLDDGLEETFPASDPVAVMRLT